MRMIQTGTMSGRIVRPGEYDYFETLRILKRDRVEMPKLDGEILDTLKVLYSAIEEEIEEGMIMYGSNPTRSEILRGELEKFRKGDPKVRDGAILGYYPKRLIRFRETDGNVVLGFFIQYANKGDELCDVPTAELNWRGLRPLVFGNIPRIIGQCGFTPEMIDYVLLPPIKIDLERRSVGLKKRFP